ncbi:MAG: cyclase family protein [Sedimentisphaerales bacterium]|nr:cyclase family protein [Sedimentisphaerales bacterium]
MKRAKDKSFSDTKAQCTTTRLIDVSMTLSPDIPVWPGAPRFEFTQKKTDIGDGQLITNSRFVMIPHCGTHIDAPLHFDKKGVSIDAVALDVLVGPCCVFEHKGSGHISKNDLVAAGFVPQARVLFKTLNSRRLASEMLEKDYIALTADAIEYLIQCGVKLLGVDGFSIGAYGETSDRNHVAFCGSGGVIIEVLNLSNVEAGEYQLIALPLKIKGVEASPARVVLLKQENITTVFSSKTS